MANIEDNKRSFEWGSLPRTFQHAIEFTRRLKIRFLWIDSICIIQDNEQDWMEQSSAMADIYQNCYLTLCATASASDDGGCFKPKPDPYQPQRVTASKRDGTQYDIFVRYDLLERHLPGWSG